VSHFLGNVPRTTGCAAASTPQHNVSSGASAIKDLMRVRLTLIVDGSLVGRMRRRNLYESCRRTVLGAFKRWLLPCACLSGGIEVRAGWRRRASSSELRRVR
jgi:hypothetical protein